MEQNAYDTLDLLLERFTYGVICRVSVGTTEKSGEEFVAKMFGWRGEYVGF